MKFGFRTAADNPLHSRYTEEAVEESSLAGAASTEHDTGVLMTR